MNVLNYKILDLPVKVYLKRVAFGGVAGFTCRHCIDEYKKKPKVFQEHLKYTLMGGGVGGVQGYLAGIMAGPGHAIPGFLSKSAIVSLFTFGFFSMRYVINSKEFKLPNKEKPIGLTLVSTIAGGIAASGVSASLYGLNARRMMGGFTTGLALGLVGHFLIEKGNVLRLEILLRKENPQLISQLHEAEKYMDMQEIIDPDYQGPVRAKPWSDYARRTLAEFHSVKERLFDSHYEDLTSPSSTSSSSSSSS